MENGTLNGASQGTINQGTKADNIIINIISHANRILKRLIAIVKKKIIIPASINDSFQIILSPTPFIITDLTIL